MYIHVFNRESPCINYCLIYFIKHNPPFLFKLNLFVDFIQLQAQYVSTKSPCMDAIVHQEFSFIFYPCISPSRKIIMNTLIEGRV